MSMKELIPLFQTETVATLYMVSISTLISYLIGIPLGVILVVTEDGGLYPLKLVHGVLGFITNIFRTIPFLILLVMVLPLTKFLVKTTLGPNAIIPPLVIAAAQSLYRCGNLHYFDSFLLRYGGIRRRRRTWSHCAELWLLSLQDGYHDHCGFSTDYYRADYSGILDEACKVQ